jgi:hypothetical protein
MLLCGCDMKRESTLTRKTIARHSCKAAKQDTRFRCLFVCTQSQSPVQAAIGHHRERGVKANLQKGVVRSELDEGA